MKRSATAGTSVRYAAAAARRSEGGSACIAWPQPGQKAAVAGMGVAHFGQTSSGAAAPTALDEAPAIVLLSTVFADAVDLECVAGGQVVVLAADGLFDFSNLGREEFDRRAALGADHVVMAASIVLVLVAGDAVVEGDFAGEAGFGQQLECAVDGGESDVRVFFLDQAVKFVGGEMLARVEESSQDGIALAGLLEADALEVAEKDAFGFAEVFAGNGRLIVNSFLEHAVAGGTWRRKALGRPQS